MKSDITVWLWCAIWLLVALPGFGQTPDLASAQLQIAGTRLAVSPASQTVPFDTPTIVETTLKGYDPASGVLPPNLRVVADFTGPEVDGVLELETVPNEPFRIPRLRLKGEYLLSNIRLLQDDELLAYAEPRDVAILVTQILITRVSSRALTLDEIRSYGIVISDDSFQAFNLTFGFGINGEVIDYNMPILYSRTGGGGGGFFRVLTMPTGSGQGRFKPPQLVPFQLRFPDTETPEVPTGGCPVFDCIVETPAPPMVGVILFPTDIRLLHQFFSVVLMVQNGAPAGDPLVVKDLTAKIRVPFGLREAETEPPTPLGVPVPVRVPGPDGQLGTADDLNLLIAQASGEAGFLLEGLKEGTHVVDFELEGLLEGLPTGVQRITGTARGAVVVRDPSLSVTITHPDVVRVDEDYSLYLTVSNIGNAPVNLLSFKLPTSELSGVQLLSANEQTIPQLLPGDSDVVEFLVRSKRTGRVIASSVKSGSSIQPHFEFTLGVGENGIPLSPTTLILPKRAQEVPADLFRWSLSLIGLGHSLAGAPPSLGGDLPRVGGDVVQRRIYRLSQAGRYVQFGEDPFDALAVMAAEWNGARDADWGWDELRRTTNKGGLVADELSKVFAAKALTSTPRGVLDRLAEITHFLLPQQGVVSAGSGTTLRVESRTSGKAVAGSGVDPDRLRQLPFGELFTLGQGELALLSVPEDGGYRARLRDSDGGLSELHLLVPPLDGTLRMARWTNIQLGANGEAVVEFRAQDSQFMLSVDQDGDGIEDALLPATMATIAPRPFQVIFAQQNATADHSGHVIDLLFTADVDLGSLYPPDSNHFLLPDKLSNGGLIPSEESYGSLLAGGVIQENPLAGLRDTRIIRVIFNNPLSPFKTHNLTVADIGSVTGELLTQQVVPVEITVSTPGILVEGVVIGSDGLPLPFAKVELYESDPCTFCIDSCDSHLTAAVRADSVGHYSFDYVRATPCSDIFRIRAEDPVSDKSGSTQGRVRFIGETQELDVVMVGRGRIEGRVLYEDGTVPEGLRIIAHNPVFEDGRLAHVDENGYYDVGDVIVGTVTLSATDIEGNFVFKTIEIPSSGSLTTQDLTILRLQQPTGELRGVVYEADGVTPAPNAYVALYVEAQLVNVLRSGVDGTFNFGRVPAGVGLIEAFDAETRREGGQLFFDITADQVQNVSIILRDDRGTVEGYVYRRSAAGITTPVAGAVVWVANLPFNTTTDATGFYRLEGVFAGNRSIQAADLQSQEKVSAGVTVGGGLVVNRDLYFVDGLPNGGVTGQVLDFDGSPVAGAVVHLSGGYRSQFWHHIAYTDGSGRFAIADLSPGRFGVHAIRGGDGAIQFAEIRFKGDTPFVTVQFRKGTIRGRTMAQQEDGSLQGVQSQIVYRHVEVQEEVVSVSWVPHTLQTDGEGYFEISDVLIGPYELRAHNAFHGVRYAAGELVQHGDVVNHDFVYAPNGTITGVVYDHDGVTPAVGATVNIVGGSFAEYDVATDQDGRFTFHLVPSGNYSITAKLETGVIFRQEQVWAWLQTKGGELDIEMTLPKQGTVAGWVDDSNGFPVPGAIVTLRERSYPGRVIVHNADGEGNFQFDNIFSGEVTLTAQAPTLGGIGGKDNATVSFEGEEVLSIITLASVGELIGTVINPADGLPVPQARVYLYRSGFVDSVTSDPQGEYRFRQLPLGNYRLRAFDPRTGRNGLSEFSELAANNQVLTADVLLEVRGVVDGHLTEPRLNTGVPGASIRLTSESLARLTTYSSTEIDGYFEFLGIPEGPFTLATTEPFGHRKATGGGVILEEGVRVTVDLVFARLGRIIGSILNPPGMVEGLFENVNIRLIQAVEGNSVIVGATSENPFVFEGVFPDSKFKIIAEEIAGPHWTEARGTFGEEGGELEVNARMQAVGSMTVSVYDSFAQPVAGADVLASSKGTINQFNSQSFSASTGPDHRVTFNDVVQGNLWARGVNPLTDLRGSVSGVLQLEGENVELEVRLQPSGWVRGRVLLSDGVSPAVGAIVALIGSDEYQRTVDTEGNFEFEAIPLQSLRLVAQELFGRGTTERFASLTENGQIVDLGTLVLDDFDPEVVAIDPPAGARDLLHTTAVTITFSEPIWASRYNAWVTFRRLGGNYVPFNRTWSPDATQLTLTPKNPLANSTTYEVKLNTGIIDLAGRHMNWRVSSSFTTADLVPPTVIDIDPANGSSQAPIDESIMILFSEPLALASLSGPALQLTDLTTGVGLTTTFQLRPGEREVILTPISGMQPDRLMQVTVQNVADPVGNAMTQPEIFTFWTPDLTPPQLTWVEPAVGETFTAGEPIPASVNASDNRGMKQVDFVIEGWSWSDTGTPFTQTLLAPVVSVASDVVVNATAVDIFGNETTLSRSVHIEPRVNANGPLVEVSCLQDGDLIQPGTTLLWDYAISDDEMIESYTFSVDGVAVESATKVNLSSVSGTFSWIPPWDALPGTAFVVRMEARDFAGNVGVVTATLSVPLGTLTSHDQVLNSQQSGTDLILGEGNYTLDIPFQLASLTMLRGARIITRLDRLDIDVAGATRMQCGSSLDVNGIGYAGGTGQLAGGAPEGIPPSFPDAGGSHGGAGHFNRSPGPAGEVYDSVYFPQLAGGGGAQYTSAQAGFGGGILFLKTASLDLDGELLARGSEVPGGGGGGGGSIVVTATSLTGAGLIDASGGNSKWANCCGNASAGGGGRVALYVDSVSGFNLDTQALAQGGGRSYNNKLQEPYAAPGTLYWRKLGSTFGDLRISNGFESDGRSRRGGETQLPTLGEGAVVALTVSGLDGWLKIGAPMKVRWIGSWVELLDSTGSLIGSYEVAEVNAAGDALMVGAATAIAAATYRGTYRFDTARLINAQLTGDSALHLTHAEVAGVSNFGGELTVDELTVVSGGQLAAPDHGALAVRVLGNMTIEDGGVVLGSEVSLDVGGTLAVQLGGTINVDRGIYAGGQPTQAAEAPAWVGVATKNSGGGHGGVGLPGNRGGVGGEVYGSVYYPTLGGGGGGYAPQKWGHYGAGVVAIQAASVILDGAIEAQAKPTDYRAGGGAGGSVLIQAGSLAGSGTINASGSVATTTNRNEGGPSGGGRVALLVDDLSAFAASQILVRGGLVTGSVSGPVGGAPGTLLLRDAGKLYGDLVIDAGTFPDGTELPSLLTTLPELVSAAVATWQPAGPDGWLTSGELFRQRWLGTWVTLLDGTGVELGSFLVGELDALGRLRLLGAGAVTAPISYRGDYRFDDIHLRNGAGLAVPNPVAGENVVFEGEAEWGAALSAASVVVKSGATLRPASINGLDLKISGTLTVEAGGSINLDGFGYPDGGIGQPGGAAVGAVAAKGTSGGGHGGAGISGSRVGDLGGVNDSVYWPRLGGGSGGSGPFSNYRGGPGGGVLRIEAQAVQLDGTLSANGLSDFYNGGGGAGGTIFIEAQSVAGSGSIEAMGSDVIVGGCCNLGGVGGGGRVALYVDDMSAFPPSRIRVRGGERSGSTSTTVAAPSGTLLLFDATAIYGDLVVNAASAVAPPATELPTLGGGSIVSLQPLGEDALLSIALPFGPQWWGAWVVLEGAAGIDLGRFQVSEVDEQGRLVLAGAGSQSGALAYRGEYRFDSVTVLSGAGLVSNDPIAGPEVVLDGETVVGGPIVADTLTVKSGAVVRPAPGQEIRFEVSGTLTIEAGALLDVSGTGFAPGTDAQRNGLAPAWVTGSQPDAGGSHGGLGVPSAGDVLGGAVFDSVYEPQLAGGGGGDGGGSGGFAGGGVIHISAGTLVLNGELRSRGLNSTGYTGGAGSGGTVLIQAGTVSGTGLIDASGGDYVGNAGNREGSGGGGRVSIRSSVLSGFDPVAQTRVWGGAMKNGTVLYGYAAPGTVLYTTGVLSQGVLVVDSGTFETLDRSTGPATELPLLGSGEVSAFQVSGLDLWVASTQPFLPRWSGGWMVLLDSAGAQLGSFRVSAVAADGRALLAGAGAVTAAASYKGEYRFDQIHLLRGAGLTSADPVLGAQMDLFLSGDVELTGSYQGRDATLAASTVVQPIPGTTAIQLDLSGTLTVPVGSRIDASGFGYAPGVSASRDGQAPSWVASSQPDAGGSHGGVGVPYNGTGLGGEVYDSVYEPRLAGGGGSDGGGSGGFAGGGVIDISAGTLNLNGELRSRGLNSTGYTGGAGGGGTVRIQAGTVSGTGLIDASGGDYLGNAGNPEGAGGGGRVSIHVTALSGFDPLAQTRVWGGAKKNGNVLHGYAAPGTVLYRTGVLSQGVLIVDSGTFENQDRSSGPATELPLLGTGTVLSTEVSGPDLWVASTQPFQPRWEGSWMVLLDSAGTPLGDFRVARLATDGRLLLAGAAAVTAANTYSGEYRFDQVHLLRGAGLVSTDPVVSSTMDLFLSGDAELTGSYQGHDVTLAASTVVRPIPGATTIQLDLSGTLTVPAGSRIDATGFGYAPGTTANPDGQAPGGVRGSQPDAGGSHGGVGVPYDSAGVGGEIYDSVYQPRLGGGGGGDGGGSSGFAGGGVIEISAAAMVLDGELRARGLNSTGYTGGAGGGGTVRLDLGTLSGVGLIDVTGGDYLGNHGNKEGAGGGGRVALQATNMVAFDPLVQTRAWGGAKKNGAIYHGYAVPGTVLYKSLGHTHGVLVIDSGTFETRNRVGPSTTLPAIYKGEVGAVTAAGADLWIEPLDPVQTFAVGVVGMWVRIGAVEYAVVDQSADRRQLLLSGAAATVTVGDFFVGLYKFDQVVLRRGATLLLRDDSEIGSLDADATSSLVELDLDPPVITNVLPLNDAIFAAGNSVVMSADVSDGSVIQSVTFRLGAQSFVDDTAPYTWTVVVPVVTAPVDLTFEVEALDEENNQSLVSQTIHYQSLPSGVPPTVAILQPSAGALLAPGTGLLVSVDATDDHAVERVEFAVDGQLVTTLLAPPWQVAVTAPATAIDGDVVTVLVTAYDLAGQTGTASLTLGIVEGVVVNGDRVVSAGDLSLDGSSVIVASGTLIFDGPHVLRDLVVLPGAKVGHLPATGADEGSLVGYWPFDDSADPSANLAGGASAGLGSLVGADANDPLFLCDLALIAPAPGNGCGLELTGAYDGATGDYATVANSAALDFTARYTLSGWVRMDSGIVTHRPIWMRGADDGTTSANDIEVYRQATSGDLVVLHNRSNGGSQDWVAFEDPPQDAFFHLVVSYDGAKMRVYYNGVAQVVRQQNNSLVPPLATGRDWLFGKVNHSIFNTSAAGSSRLKFLDGALDEVRFYDRAMSANETLALAQSGTLSGQGLELILTRDLYVAAGGAIDATAQGYPGGSPSAGGYPGGVNSGANVGAGGSHGGRGGNFDGSAPTYGGVFNPRAAGGGGVGTQGTAGGGVIRVAAGGRVVIDGAVLATGGGEGLAVQHGAGGSIRLDATALSGQGTIDASGAGLASSTKGAGGGGRVAIYATTFDAALRASTRAHGGAASTAVASGGAGTVLVKLDSQPFGELTVDNGTTSSSQLTGFPAVGQGAVTALGADTVTDSAADFLRDLTGVELAFNSNLTSLWLITDHAHHGQTLNLDVATQPLTAQVGDNYEGVYRFDAVTVSGGAQAISLDRIESSQPPTVATGALWQVGSVPTVAILSPAAGASFNSGAAISLDAQFNTNLGIASVTMTFDGQAFSATAPPFSWQTVAPIVTTPTVMEVTLEARDRDGHLFRRALSVTIQPLNDPTAPTVVLGACPAQGDLVAPGTVLGLSFDAADNELLFSYALIVDGVVGETVSNVAQPSLSAALNWTVPAGATPGTLFTVGIQVSDYSGNVTAAIRTVTVPAGLILAGDQGLDSTLNGQDLILGQGTFTANGPLAPNSLTLLGGAVLTAPVGGILAIDAATTVRVQCGGRLDVSMTGYLGGRGGLTGAAPAGLSVSNRNAGGSHGGAGSLGMFTGAAGEVFGSVYRPTQGGGGGGRYSSSYHGGDGGGVIDLRAATVILEGDILARGEDRDAGAGGWRAGGGAGGSILITAGSLVGSGTINADGGWYQRTNSDHAGGGGGGRVALHVNDLTGFDIATQARAFGGAKINTDTTLDSFAAPGTVYVKDATATYGRLILNAGVEQGADRRGLSTTLPSLGSGTVTALVAQGVDALLVGVASFQPRWIGSWVALADSAGAALGAFEVLTVDGSGNLLLAGAASAVAGATSYAGEYRFDAIDQLHGAGLATSDRVHGGAMTLAGAVRLPRMLEASQMTLTSGSVATPASGDLVSIDVSGTLTVEAGATIDLSSQGYAGATGGLTGSAPAGISVSNRNAGGSHGGIGALGMFTGAAGEVYDSVYLPSFGGGGGGRYSSTYPGGNGGGLLLITAGQMVLDGELKARGQDRDAANGGWRAGAGAGGSVVIEANSLRGAGSIDVAGGWYQRTNSDHAGGGGGGRVALYVTDLTLFDVATQVEAFGGAKINTNSTLDSFAGAGTIYVKDGAAVFGELIVNAGFESGADRVGPATQLPTLGTGTVSSLVADVADGWLTGSAAFQERWLGAWVVLEDGGGAEIGTFRVGQLDLAGRLRLEGAGAVTTAVSYRGLYRFDAIQHLHGGRLDAVDGLEGGAVTLTGQAALPPVLVAKSLTLNAGASVTPAIGGSLDLTIEGALTIHTGAVLDVSILGYAGATGGLTGASAPGMTVSNRNAGGSHGGAGSLGMFTGLAGEVFDSVYQPRLSGGGGGRYSSSHPGGNGGGTIAIEAGSVVLHGEIRARGQNRDHSQGGWRAGGGAGGSVLLRAGALSGGGLIDASGGDYQRANSDHGGAGGGGRVALWVDNLSQFDAANQVRAWGGAKINTNATIDSYAAAGTILTFDLASTYGHLIVGAGERAGVDRVGLRTLLPALGTGAVTLFAANVGDGWLSAATPFGERWLGAWVVLSDALGVELGGYRVAEIDPAGRLLLTGAGGLAGVATYRGEYRFDAISLLDGGGVDATDPVLGGVVVASGAAGMPPALLGTSLTIAADGWLRPASGGSLLIELSGTLRIESGGKLDTSYLGYAGGTSGLEGAAPVGVSVSARNAGGSHGGPGSLGMFTGVAGEVYDSVYQPWLAGGGGGRYSSSHRGGNGGGVISISAAAVELEGEILARGEDRDAANLGWRAGGGSGGTVAITAASIAGAGRIDVSGGDHKRSNSDHGGAGGGGRVALYIDNLGFFDVTQQVTVAGGVKINSNATHDSYGASGTLLLVDSTATYGALYLDQEGQSGIVAVATPLPRVGGTTVGLSEVDVGNPANLWIEPSDLTATFSLGVTGLWLRIGGVDYRILDQTSDRRKVLLAGAAATVIVGQTYEGVYKFDSVTVHGGAQLVLDEITESGGFVMDADSLITGPHAP